MRDLLIKEWLNGEQYQNRIENYLNEVNSIIIPKLDERVIIHEYAEKLSKNAWTLFLSVKTQDIASCSVYCNQEFAFITSIAVLPQYQKQGLGHILIEETKDFIRSKGCQGLRLDVHGSNLIAIHFYEKLGMRVVEQKDGWLKMEEMI